MCETDKGVISFDQTDPHYSLVQLQLDESHETCVPIKIVRKTTVKKMFWCRKTWMIQQMNFFEVFFYLKYFYFLVWTIRSPTHDIRGKNIVFVVLICSLISVNCGDDVLICSLVLVICGHVLIHYLVLVHFDHVVLNRSLFLVNCGHFVVICSLVLIFCGYIVLIRPLALVNFSTITSLVLVNCSDIVPPF